MKNFEMADSTSVESIVEATQKAILGEMLNIINSFKKSSDFSKSPGLTWEQIEFLIEELKKKKAMIINQEESI